MSETVWLIERLRAALPPARVITDPLRRLAYGTDASFYRLVPEVVVVVESEAEVREVLAAATAAGRPITFRAAGTSLSGQAITDGVLVLVGDGFATCAIAADAASVRLGPGMIGGEVNARLAPHRRKIGPDPASIGSCKIGGIAANNASGLCCGTARNSYHTLIGLRVMLADGAVLDTLDPASVAAFRHSHAGLLDALARLGEEVRADQALAGRIHRKFKIKNTTGYSLNALVDFTDPIDILAHLMIGSEGTLGFLASLTYATVAEDPHRASALVFFPTLAAACAAVPRLKPEAVAAVELLDRAALRSVEEQPGLPDAIRALPAGAAALLIETRAADRAGLDLRVARIEAVLAGEETLGGATFTSDPALCETYWKVRKGTFPSVGAMRRTGTTVIIEDVAFPLAALADATRDLQELLARHGYHEAILFGHALEGNLHFVFTQDFSTPAEIERYARFMNALCHLVVDRHDGSLKAEHGTGRNMAPFVELEWGRQATGLMRRIKALFDPRGLLNPGVILSADPQAHLRHLKPLPPADPLIDRCIECGFCEPLCPSHRLTLSPRQRITTWREIRRRATEGVAATALNRDFPYFGLDTCADCGLCATACPVGIDTGALARRLRGQRQTRLGHALGGWAADHFGGIAAVSRLGLGLGQAAETLVGRERLNRLSGGRWRTPMPRPGRCPAAPATATGDPVLYLPACGGRIFGPDTAGVPSQPEVVLTVLRRAGYAPRLPDGVDHMCCGQMLASRGLDAEADRLALATVAALRRAADDGRGGLVPIVTDASPCAARLRPHLTLWDFPDFAHDALLPRLRLIRRPETVALHVNCSLRRQGGEARLRAVVAACVERVVDLPGIGCCGFGGDKGFTTPELNAHALRGLRQRLPDECGQGVSSNRTCEIGLGAETGRPFRSLAHLLEECSRAMEG